MESAPLESKRKISVDKVITMRHKYDTDKTITQWFEPVEASMCTNMHGALEQHSSNFYATSNKQIGECLQSVNM